MLWQSPEGGGEEGGEAVGGGAVEGEAVGAEAVGSHHDHPRLFHDQDPPRHIHGLQQGSPSLTAGACTPCRSGGRRWSLSSSGGSSWRSPASARRTSFSSLKPVVDRVGRSTGPSTPGEGQQEDNKVWYQVFQPKRPGQPTQDGVQ